MSEHAGRSLSLPSDKLVALSAVASRIQAVFGGTYLAGLWKGDLLRELLWHCQRSGPEDFKAPSWSWVSVSGGLVNFFTKELLSNDRELAQIVDTSVIRSTSNIFGSVSSGTITIRGKLILSTFRGRESPKYIHDCIRVELTGCSEIYGLTDMPLVACDAPIAKDNDYTEASTRRIRYSEKGSTPDDWHMAAEFPVWILPLLQEIGLHGRDIPICLVLGRSMDWAGCFERLGVIFMVQYHDTPKAEVFLNGYPDQEVTLV
jgi:hypothetical protein